MAIVDSARRVEFITPPPAPRLRPAFHRRCAPVKDGDDCKSDCKSVGSNAPICESSPDPTVCSPYPPDCARQTSEVDTATTPPRADWIEEVRRIDLDIKEELGSGGQAQVFRAYWKGRMVAVKQLYYNRAKHRGLASLKEEILMAREASILAITTHKNLVQFYGADFQVRPYYFVCELCEGGSCYELLHKSDHIDLTWHQRITICRDTASAMAYLHGMMIIHRDLKSLNVLLYKAVRTTLDHPHIKVTDFGVSRIMDQKSSNSMTVGVGTSHWMAPEVCAGSGYDLKADVYSYAMFCYEVVGREMPWYGVDPVSVALLSQTGERPDLDLLPDDCPESLIDLIQVCWDILPEERPEFDVVVEALLTLSGPEDT